MKILTVHEPVTKLGHSSEYFLYIIQTHNTSTRRLCTWTVWLKVVLWALLFFSNLTSSCSILFWTAFLCLARTVTSSEGLSPFKSAFFYFLLPSNDIASRHPHHLYRFIAFRKTFLDGKWSLSFRGCTSFSFSLEAFDSTFCIALIEAANIFSWKFPYAFPKPVRNSYLESVGNSENFKCWQRSKE